MSGLTREAARPGEDTHLAGKSADGRGADAEIGCDLGEWSVVVKILLSHPVGISAIGGRLALIGTSDSAYSAEMTRFGR